MSTVRLPYPASAIAGSGRITREDILLLRKHAFPLGIATPDDALHLLTLHRAPLVKCAEWDGWFIEAMAAYIVFHSYPQRSLDEVNADWIIGMIAPEGVIESAAELEFLLHAMELARSVPDTLSSLAIDQLRLALKGRACGYGDSRDAKRTGIAACDIDYLYRILRGRLCRGRLLVSAREVAALDRLTQAVEGQRNHPAWETLMRSVALRSTEGEAPASGWLRMVAEQACRGVDFSLAVAA